MSDRVRKVLYIQYTDPAGYPPLQHSARIFARRGWRVRSLGTQTFGFERLRFPTDPNIRVDLLPYCPPGWAQKLHYAWFVLWTILTALVWRPRWIYASDLLSCPPALVLSYLPGWHLAYHEHDSPNPPSAATGAFQRLLLAARARLARRAARCVLPNAERIARFRAETGTTRPVVEVWNCPARDEVPHVVARPTGEGVLLHYHGNIGPELAPLVVVDAIARVPATRFRCIGYLTQGQESYVTSMVARAAAAGVADRVLCLPAMPRQALLEAAREATVGLCVMPIESTNLNLRHMVGASNKIFDYLACGLAVLVSDAPEWRTTFVEAGYGLACRPDDPDSIAQALRWFVEHPEETRAMGERGRARVLSEWNYEHQFEALDW